MSLPHWRGNSCYLNAVTVALFKATTVFDQFMGDSFKTVYTDAKLYCGENPQQDLENRRKVIQELSGIVEKIRIGDPVIRYTSCSFRHLLFSLCPLHEFKVQTITQYKDAVEFLYYFFSVFKIPGDQLISKIRGAQEEYEVQPYSPIMMLESPRKNVMISSLFPFVVEQENGVSIKTDFLYDNQNFFILNCNPHRNYIFNNRSVRVLRNNVIPDEVIIRNGITFSLTSVVSFEGKGFNHFICYYKLGNVWVFYNDNDKSNPSKTINLGSYANMINYRNGLLLTLGIIFLYVRPGFEWKKEEKSESRQTVDKSEEKEKEAEMKGRKRMPGRQKESNVENIKRQKSNQDEKNNIIQRFSVLVEDKINELSVSSKGKKEFLDYFLKTAQNSSGSLEDITEYTREFFEFIKEKRKKEIKEQENNEIVMLYYEMVEIELDILAFEPSEKKAILEYFVEEAQAKDETELDVSEIARMILNDAYENKKNFYLETFAETIANRMGSQFSPNRPGSKVETQVWYREYVEIQDAFLTKLKNANAREITEEASRVLSTLLTY